MIMIVSALIKLLQFTSLSFGPWPTDQLFAGQTGRKGVQDNIKI